MFNLNQTITAYNKDYDAKLKLHKTWGLVYLQPKPLAFLNQCFQLIDESVYYASPFASDRKLLRSTLSKTKKQLPSEALPTLRNIVQQLKMDQTILQRLHWEERLRVQFNNKTLWQEHISRTETHPRIQSYLKQLETQWNIHQPFQYHSSCGLLFLLDVVIEYQYHFTRAQKELRKKQSAWFPFLRLPDVIAEKYSQFLANQLNDTRKLQSQVIEALLVRLKVAQEQNQVTCDDISYFLAKESERLGFPSTASLPKRQMVLTPTTFNNIHRTIEKHGTAKQKKQLYRLTWYEYAEFNSENITVITASQQRLLAPKALLNFLPKQYRKFAFFTNKTTRLKFLEEQQALLAQLALSSGFTKLPVASVSITHLTLRSTITRHQLLQQALKSLAQQATPWWRWQQKHWKKAWHKWLSEQLQKNQTSLSDCLFDFYEKLQSHENLLSQASFCEKVRCIIQSIRTLSNNDPIEHRNILLAATLERLATVFQEKNASSTSDALVQSFKNDLLSALQNYIQIHRSPERRLPKEKLAEVLHLQELLNSKKNIIELREVFIAYYRSLQPSWLTNLSITSDCNFFRGELIKVLNNPKYSREQLNRAVLPQAEENKPCLFVSGSNNSQLTTEEEIDQLKKRIQQLTDNTEGSYSFFKALSKNDTDNNSNLLKKIHRMA